MFGLLPVWLALFATLVGWGLLLTRVLRRVGGPAFSGSLSVFQTMWLGYCGLLAFILACSLILPVSTFVVVLAWPPALLGLYLGRAGIARRVLELRLRPRIAIVCALVVVLVCLAVAWAACDQTMWYDTGLYHLNAVKWNATYSAVPGLANLHTRLGYDNSVLVFDAFVDGYWEGVAVHITTGFFLAMVLAQWFVEIFTARTPRGRLRQVYCLLTLPYLLAKLWTIEVASFSTDLTLGLMCSVLVLELLSLPERSQRRLLHVAFIAALAAVVTTTKLGGLGLAAVATFTTIVLLRREAWRAIVLVLALPVLLGVVWMVRNVIVSGWLVFPVFGNLHLSWSVPDARGHEHLRWIQSWARVPGKLPDEVLDHGFRHWLVPWFEQFRVTREAMLFVGSLGLFVWRLATGPARSAATRAGEWTAIAACVVGGVQWFFGAPDIRFGGFLFWLLPATLLAPALAGAARERTLRTFVFAMSLGLTGWNGGLTPRLGVPPRWFQRPREHGPVTTVVHHTGPGTDVQIPAEGDQCWDSDMMCTPELVDQALRNPGDRGAGFKP